MIRTAFTLTEVGVWEFVHQREPEDEDPLAAREAPEVFEDWYAEWVHPAIAFQGHRGPGTIVIFGPTE